MLEKMLSLEYTFYTKIQFQSKTCKNLWILLNKLSNFKERNKVIKFFLFPSYVFRQRLVVGVRGSERRFSFPRN